MEEDGLSEFVISWLTHLKRPVVTHHKNKNLNLGTSRNRAALWALKEQLGLKPTGVRHQQPDPASAATEAPVAAAAAAVWPSPPSCPHPGTPGPLVPMMQPLKLSPPQQADHRMLRSPDGTVDALHFFRQRSSDAADTHARAPAGTRSPHASAQRHRRGPLTPAAATKAVCFLRGHDAPRIITALIQTFPAAFRCRLRGDLASERRAGDKCVLHALLRCIESTDGLPTPDVLEERGDPDAVQEDDFYTEEEDTASETEDSDTEDPASSPPAEHAERRGGIPRLRRAPGMLDLSKLGPGRAVAAAVAEQAAAATAMVDLFDGVSGGDEEEDDDVNDDVAAPTIRRPSSGPRIPRSPPPVYNEWPTPTDVPCQVRSNVKLADDSTAPRRSQLSRPRRRRRPRPHVVLSSEAAAAVVEAVVRADPTAVRLPNESGRLPLHLAMVHIQRPKLCDAVVRILLQAWPGAAACPDHGKNASFLPLHVAAARFRGPAGERLARRLVLAHPAALRIKADLGHFLPLHCAMRYPRGRGAERIGLYLMRAYPEGRASVNHEGWTPLALALMHHHGRAADRLVMNLLDGAPELAMRPVDDGDGWLPLHLAAQEQTGPYAASILRRLLRAGPEAAAMKEKDDWAPLHVAVQNQTGTCAPEVIRMLLDACPEAADLEEHQGYFPLHVAARGQGYGHGAAIVQQLLELRPQLASAATRHGSLTPLHLAAGFFDGPEVAAVAAALIGADPAAAVARDSDGWTPLHFAARRSRADGLIRVLLTAAPEAASMATDAGWLPLSIAVEHQQGPEALEVIRMLLQAHSAATRVTNSDGWTATHLAACHQRGPRSLEVIALLLAAAPHSVRWHTHKDWLPLHVCTEHQKDELALPTVTMLAEACPDATKQPNSDGWLPLHLAVGHQRGTESVKVAELLANLNPKALTHTTNRGSTPLHIASQNQRGPHAAAMLSLLHERQPGMARAVNHDGDLPIDLLVINVGHGLNNAPGGGAARELQEAVLVLVRAYPEGAARAIELRRIAPALRTTVMDGLLSTAPLSALSKELVSGGWSLGHALRRELWQAVVLPRGGPDGRPSREVSAAREPITAGICTFVAAMLEGMRRRVMTRLDPASASAWELAEKEEGAGAVVAHSDDDAARSHAISAATTGGERRIAAKDVVRKVDALPTSSSASSASRGGIGVIIPSSRACNTGLTSGAERPLRPSAMSRPVRPDLPRPRLTYLYSRRHADVYGRFADHVDACETMRARPDCLRFAPGATPAQQLALAALARHFVHLYHDETAFAVVVPVWLPLSPAALADAGRCPAASTSFGCDRDLEARIVASVAPVKRHEPVRAWLTPEAVVQDALTSAISTGASILGKVQVVLALAALGAVRPVTRQGGGVEAALDDLLQRRQAAERRAAAAAAEGPPKAKRARRIRLVEEDDENYSEVLGGAWSGALPQVHYVRLQPDLSSLAPDLLAQGGSDEDPDDLVARAAREGRMGFEQLQLPADALLPVGVVDL